MNGMGGCGKGQLDRIAIIGAARLFLSYSHLHARVIMNQARKTLHLVLDSLTHLRCDMHLFSFDNDLHSSPSLSSSLYYDVRYQEVDLYYLLYHPGLSTVCSI